MKLIRVLAFGKLDADKIQRPRRDKALEKSLLPALEPQTSALKTHLAGAHRHKGLGLGARHLRAFLGSHTVPIASKNQKTVFRLDADEVIPAGARWEVSLHDAVGWALFFSDE